jgi:hypothetical protein
MSKARELIEQMNEARMGGTIKISFDGDVMVRGSDGKTYFGVIQNIKKVNGSKFVGPKIGFEREFLDKDNPLSFLDKLPAFKHKVKFKPEMIAGRPIASDIEV